MNQIQFDFEVVMAEVIGMDGTFREKYEEFDNDHSHLETAQRPTVPVTSDRERPRIGTEWPMTTLMQAFGAGTVLERNKVPSSSLHFLAPKLAEKI